MLALREIANLVIAPRRPAASNARRRPARGAFDTQAVLNALLVAHALDAVARDRARGAQKAKLHSHPSPEPGRKGPSPPLPPLALIPSNEGGCLLLTPRGPETPGSRAVCVGSNGETALVRAPASARTTPRRRPPRNN